PQDIEWTVSVFREEVDTVREQLGLDRIHLLGTSWGGMLALEHVLAGADGIVGLILSSTLANVDQWAAEQMVLRNAIPPDVVDVLDRHDRAGTYDDPEYERAMQGPNEWTVTGAIKGWDVRDRLKEIDIPTLVIRGRHDMCTDPIAETL